MDIALAGNFEEFGVENYNNFCISNNKELVDNLKTLTSNLTEDKPFEFIDLGLSNKDLKNIEEFDIDKSKAYLGMWDVNDFCNKFNVIDNFIHTVSHSSSASEITGLMFKLFSAKIESFANINDNKVIQVLIRASAPSDINRNELALNWHTDPCNSQISQECPDETGFSFVLKGPSTLFYNDSTANFDIHESQKKIDKTKITSSSSGQGTIFAMGETKGATHAVPTSNVGRLFALITIRDKEETLNYMKPYLSSFKPDDDTIYDLGIINR